MKSGERTTYHYIFVSIYFFSKTKEPQTLILHTYVNMRHVAMVYCYWYNDLTCYILHEHYIFVITDETMKLIKITLITSVAMTLVIMIILVDAIKK